MVRYILQRFVGMAVVMFLVVTIVFVIVRVTPGDPAAVMLGPDASAQDIADLRARLGLDQSLVIQYFYYIGQLLKGDLGQSIFLNMPVGAALLDRAEPTFFLTVLSLLIACIIALPVGVYAAYRRGSFVDQAATTVAMLAASIPSFWLGLILMQFFAVRLNLFPVSGYGGPGSSFIDRMYHLILPAIALGLVSSALILRFTRASMLDVLGDDYIRTARAKGLIERRVIMKHALKNALIPILTVVGLTAAVLISGAVVTETVFGLPGVGNLVVSAVLRRDYPVIQGALLVIAGLYVLINFIIDMLYLFVDPRVRY
ncbi:MULTISPECIES: ABC transporter permease [Brucella/Ochrobactrum group]|jgi:peptide/nickel transport system permease protein|uniref:Binding-protein-dependent transport systems inner membrane component n=3 Tax=Brucella anthropi TaxID=529 RepID=A6X389_BRUA4|nr:MULTISPECIES: ABC transporter permease [Brucella/Ochrobactrum group]QOD66775.1 ABC transporter permease [Ochrobactrum sp. MT180101]ABS15693.1 binding-protein-dependent transport systems inner membrane component [Brucella anthropi ATCC 49188]AIK41769.1 binding--dependent transport system inner membrane component family protein [Brucella anthropi]EXL05275.1 peptide ABC transporter [Brucella anthropi]KIU69985.1 peptide ABC transporter [Brucella anthropi]